MTQNRPWSIWWDFRDEYVVVQLDHPDYENVDYIHRVLFDDIAVDGFIDHWASTWFYNFKEDLETGHVSLHKLMSELGYTKKSNYKS